jgi:hypothetical protein
MKVPVWSWLFNASKEHLHLARGGPTTLVGNAKVIVPDIIRHFTGVFACERRSFTFWADEAQAETRWEELGSEFLPKYCDHHCQ